MAIISPTEEYNKHLPRWKLIRSVLDSTILDYDVWKEYLFIPESSKSFSDPDKQRQRDYVRHADLLPATQRTVHGGVGAVFRKASTFDLKPNLDYMQLNADGSGNSLEQVAKSAVKDNISYGYGGFLCDFAEGAEPTTKAGDGSGGQVAAIVKYNAESIIRVSTKMYGMERRVSMIVLAEEYDASDGEFEEDMRTQYRILSYDENGDYIQRVKRENADGAEEREELFEPKDYRGKRLSRIPFSFFGAQSNDSAIDDSPMYPMARTNSIHLGHSATRNESIRFILPTVLLMPGEGVDPTDFVKDEVKITLGANQAYVGFTGQILQASPNDAASTEMVACEARMVAAGAMLITPQVSNVSTETVVINRSNDTTVLSMAATNVEDALNEQLGFASEFMNAGEGNTITFNTEYFVFKMTAQEILAHASNVMNGIMTKMENRELMERAGIIADAENEEINEDDIGGNDDDDDTVGDE